MYEYDKLLASRIHEINEHAKKGWEIVPGSVFESNGVHYVLMERLVTEEPESGSLLI